MVKFLVNAIWVLNAFAWEQARLFERTLSLDSKSDLMRPRNIGDATSDLGISDKVCDFGGGLGEISKALLERGCDVVYCDSNKKFENHVVQKFTGAANFSVADPIQVLGGNAGGS